MSKEIIVATGLFSRIAIVMNDDIHYKLVLTKGEKNPLRSIAKDLEVSVKRFEREYFELVNKPEKELEE